MNTNSNLTSNPLSSMKWSEIPDATPVTALMSAVGYPEPMVILKHLSKPNKNGKKTDLSAFVQFMCLTKGNVDKLLFAGYQAIVGNSKVHTFLQNHPDYSTKLTKFLQQLQNETISEIAEKNLSVWIKELVEEQTWDTLMSETPLTLLNKLVKQFINEEFTF